MGLTELLADRLGGGTAGLIRANAQHLTNIRLRAGRPIRLEMLGGTCVQGDVVPAEKLHALLNCLLENSLYAREKELVQGFFTAMDGCRVGVCGKINAGSGAVGSLGGIGSACIRIPREVKGCAKPLADCVQEGGLKSLLLLSPPGLGKTTLLRDLVRLVSEAGYNAAIADERREVAACREGVPQLDVGPNTDVMDGLEKVRAIPMLVRACAPDIVAVDELGSMAEADAVLDACRCGVAVAATAHAVDLDDALRRPCTAKLLHEGVFRACAVLGPEPGQIKFLRKCADEGFEYAQSGIADHHPAGLHGGGADNVGAAQAEV